MPSYRFTRFEIVRLIVDNRSAAADRFTRLIIAVEAVDVVDEFPVQQVQRDVLRADAGAFAAVGAASGDVERADYVEEL